MKLQFLFFLLLLFSFGNTQNVRDYIKEYKVPWPIVIDGQHKTFLSRYNIDILPRYFLVDPAGKIIQIRGGEKKAIRMLEKSIKLYLEM